jgi:hypothetical protein
MSTIIKTKVDGHVLIADKASGEILLDRSNAIHNQNMATALSRGLSHSDYSLSVGNHQIFALCMGNGGTTVDSQGNITYLTPNIIGANAWLYNQTYYDVVDSGSSANVNGNSVTYQNSTTDTSSIVIVTMNIPAGLPIGEVTTDSPPIPNVNSQFSFDELCLATYGSASTVWASTPSQSTYAAYPSDSLLLSHIIFSPILKTANRELVITYTLTVSVS